LCGEDGLKEEKRRGNEGVEGRGRGTSNRPPSGNQMILQLEKEIRKRRRSIRHTYNVRKKYISLCSAWMKDLITLFHCQSISISL